MEEIMKKDMINKKMKVIMIIGMIMAENDTFG
jgi:hypothetical protein